jgi:hypothetical protein
MRSVGAVILGLLVIVILSHGTDELMNLVGIFPGRGKVLESAGQFVLAVVYRTLFGVVGSYVTARRAPDRPMRHALILGGIGFALSLLGLAATAGKPEFGPSWYPVVLAILTFPAAWAGGALAVKHVNDTGRRLPSPASPGTPG